MGDTHESESGTEVQKRGTTTGDDGYELRMVDLKDIKRPFKIRNRTDPATVKRYAAIFDQLPPVVLFDVEGEGFVLADGDCRVDAAELVPRTQIKANVHRGTIEDAYAFGVRANAHAGRPLTIAERNQAVLKLATQHRGECGWQSGWSQRRVAQTVGMGEDRLGHVLAAAEVAARIGAVPSEADPSRYILESDPVGPVSNSSNAESTNGLTVAHLFRIAKAPAPVQRRVAEHVLGNGWSRDKTAKMVKRITPDTKTPADVDALFSADGGGNLSPVSNPEDTQTIGNAQTKPSKLSQLAAILTPLTEGKWEDIETMAGEDEVNNLTALLERSRQAIEDLCTRVGRMVSKPAGSN